MVAFLRKVESLLNYNIEVRNYLVDKPYNTEQSQKIKDSEQELRKVKNTENQEQKQKEAQRKQEDIKARQQAKQEKEGKKIMFIGKKDAARSQKKTIRQVAKKQDKLSDQTKDEKEYLDSELFELLQEVKAMNEKGEFNKNDDDMDGGDLLALQNNTYNGKDSIAKTAQKGGDVTKANSMVMDDHYDQDTKS